MKNKTLAFISLVLSVITVTMSAISLRIKLEEISSEDDVTTDSESLESESTETSDAAVDAAASG